MAIAPLVQLLRAHEETLVDRLVIRLNDLLPAYGRLGGSEVRANVGLLVETMLEALETERTDRLTAQLFRTSRERVGQGFSIAEFLRAIHLTLPVVRELIREVGPRGDPTFGRSFSILEDQLLSLSAMAANIYTEAASRQLEAKNLELNRLNQLLRTREKVLAEEIDEAHQALESANQFNQRVIESLLSGVVVISAPDRRISLFSHRAEAIFELPAEEVLGKTGADAFARIQGIDHALIAQTVEATGRFPMTKLLLTVPGGRRKHVFVRASRLYAADGTVEGSVFVVDDVSERELLIDSFSRYVSRDLLTRLLARAEPLRLEGERRECTVLFADVRGFTGIAEHLAPEVLHRLLNDFLHVMVESIVDHGGFIDKFVGDKVMALFTARDLGAAAEAAVQAGLAIQAGIAALNGQRRSAGEPAIEVGIGVNTGPVVVGNVGAEARMDFTAIGDTVNVADRIQGLARGGELLVGGATGELVQPRYALSDLGKQAVKGRSAAVQVFRVEGIRTS